MAHLTIHSGNQPKRSLIFGSGNPVKVNCQPSRQKYAFCIPRTRCISASIAVILSRLGSSPRNYGAMSVKTWMIILKSSSIRSTVAVGDMYSKSIRLAPKNDGFIVEE
jgi:hypothetical protein